MAALDSPIVLLFQSLQSSSVLHPYFPGCCIREHQVGGGGPGSCRGCLAKTRHLKWWKKEGRLARYYAEKGGRLHGGGRAEEGGRAEFSAWIVCGDTGSSEGQTVQPVKGLQINMGTLSKSGIWEFSVKKAGPSIGTLEWIRTSPMSQTNSP